MNLEHLSKKDSALLQLLRQAQRHRQLDARVKQVFPANLAPHFRAACIDKGVLVLLAANNMAASRLRMMLPAAEQRLFALSDGISAVRVKVVPQTPAPPKRNSLRLSPAALERLEQGAQRLRHHPDLAAALEKLVRRHKP